MLRIGTRQVEDRLEVSLQGRLAGEWVEEARRALAALGVPWPQVALDLAGVRYVDREGERLLREVAATGVAIGRRSAFVDTLLQGFAAEGRP